MRPELTHVALGVRDLERTIAFYRRHVGLHVVHDRRDNGNRVVWLAERPEDPEFVLVFFEVPGDTSGPSPLQHLGFAVGSREAVDAAAEAARAEGILTHEPTYAGPVVGYFCIVQDPDGIQVESRTDNRSIRAMCRGETSEERGKWRSDRKTSSGRAPYAARA